MDAADPCSSFTPNLAGPARTALSRVLRGPRSRRGPSTPRRRFPTVGP